MWRHFWTRVQRSLGRTQLYFLLVSAQTPRPQSNSLKPGNKVARDFGLHVMALCGLQMQCAECRSRSRLPSRILGFESLCTEMHPRRSHRRLAHIFLQPLIVDDSARQPQSRLIALFNSCRILLVLLNVYNNPTTDYALQRRSCHQAHVEESVDNSAGDQAHFPFTTATSSAHLTTTLRTDFTLPGLLCIRTDINTVFFPSTIHSPSAAAKNSRQTSSSGSGFDKWASQTVH